MSRRSRTAVTWITFLGWIGLIITAPLDAQTQSDKDGQKRGWPLGDVRTWDGTGNHPDDLGAVGTPLLKISGADYPDGIGEVLRSGANPRRVSNLVVDQGGLSIPSAAGLSDAVWAWGQFIDHDLGLTDSDPANGAANIEVLDPNDLLYPVIFFNRANHIVIDGARAQINQITSFLDGSNVYGSSESRAAALRTFSRGRMKTSRGNLLPFNVDGLPNLGDDPNLFLGGDIRVNENVVLTSLHTLFVREHNRLVSRLRSLFPDADDEELYQWARKIVGAEIQKITYNEFLPALLGPYAPGGTQVGYDPSLHPEIANEFSGALFRVGHTLLSSDLVIGDTGQTIALRDAFTNPEFISSDPRNVDRMLEGLAMQRCQEIDSTIVEDVRTFLFLPPPFAVGLDLAALNIQRGRDHGLPVYNEVRAAYGLARVQEFSEISSDPAVQQALQAAYGSVDEIDAWVGGISEDHLPGANVGPLIAAALVDQFTRTRDGDRFFYTSDPALRHPWIRNHLRRVTLGTVIRDNTRSQVPRDMFFVN